jgi:predicted amidohydrolase
MISNESIRVELQQRFHRKSDVEFNLGIIEETSTSSDSDIVVFPEMFLTGYSLGDDVRAESREIEDPLFGKLSDIAREGEKHIIFGLPERSSVTRGHIHNSAMVIGPDGIIGAYRKMHLVNFGPFEEWEYFTPGNQTLSFEVKGFRIGLIICYDIFFPELTKHYALDDIDAVICISASPSVTRPYFEAVMKARAIENTIYFLYSNLVGFDSRMDFWGGGEIISPRGNTVAKGPYFEESSIRGELSADEISLARSLRPTLRDTRMKPREYLREI